MVKGTKLRYFMGNWFFLKTQGLTSNRLDLAYSRCRNSTMSDGSP
jgi:hypothetical protein